MAFEIIGIKVTQQQQMQIARRCGSDLFSAPTEPIRENIARQIRIVLSSKEVGLSNQNRKAKELFDKGLTRDIITLELCAPLRKFCR